MKTYLLSPTIVAFAFLSFNVSAQPQVHYVDLNCTNPSRPTPAGAPPRRTSRTPFFQAGPGDTVFVTNGVYQIGGWSNVGSNRVYVGIAEFDGAKCQRSRRDGDQRLSGAGHDQW